jgi:hypothetical protein
VEKIWAGVSVDTIPPRSPTPSTLHDRANEALVALLLERSPTESVALMQDVARLLREKIR